ncbi:Plasmid SOS inhibition [Salmonella enterica subsp. enterica serovar Pullorum]|nr:Plasmid SOS inhibition [Salmonella enterica subsp. enterica serovar Pullorum]
MRNIITPAVLSTMIPQEFEDWRDGGEDLRRELTHAAMRDLTCPAAVEHVCPPCHMRVLSGSSRINTTVAQRIPGLKLGAEEPADQPETGGRGAGPPHLQPRGVLPATTLRGCAGRTVPGGDTRAHRSPDAA